MCFYNKFSDEQRLNYIIVKHTTYPFFSLNFPFSEGLQLPICDVQVLQRGIEAVPAVLQRCHEGGLGLGTLGCNGPGGTQELWNKAPSKIV